MPEAISISIGDRGGFYSGFMSMQTYLTGSALLSLFANPIEQCTSLDALLGGRIQLMLKKSTAVVLMFPTSEYSLCLPQQQDDVEHIIKEMACEFLGHKTVICTTLYMVTKYELCKGNLISSLH